MKGLNNEVWVTSVVSDDQVPSALVLCCSLKRAYTSQKVAVIASAKISKGAREKLKHVFDLVFFLFEDDNLETWNLQLDDFVKLSSLAILHSFDKAVYLSPSMMAVKHSDDIFGELDPAGDIVFPKNMDLSVFLFKPSFRLYNTLKEGMCGSDMKGKPTDMANYWKTWLGNEGSCETDKALSGKYTQVLLDGKMFMGNEKDVSILNFVDMDLLGDWNESRMEKFGFLGQRLIEHWLKIYQEDVQPLMELSSVNKASIPPTIPSYNKEPIAIVGMSCRFPGSKDLGEFWKLLATGEDGTGNPPPFRWLREQCSRPCPDRETNAGFLPGPVDEFDAAFFGVSPKEVLFMDPQTRLLHELVWEGLDDAAINAHSLKGTSGSWIYDYRDTLMKSGCEDFYRGYMGNSIGAGAARISHLLEIVGPCVATESGCSSSMVAVDLACKSLHLGESNMALACGVNLLLEPFDKDAMPMVVSPDGHCKTFSDDADGYARAEGCGVLVLKRFSDAAKDGDNIWGVIRGSAMTQEGISKSMGTPTIHCESLAMELALKDGQVDPLDVSYVEAHGTGTIVGDPLEIAAITNAYGKGRSEPLVIGSVKTNVGHTESVSGITGIIKVLLSMHNNMIPAHRNFKNLNPYIDLNVIPAMIPLEKMEWKSRDGKARLAGVSSFGITGTDAHVIIEEPPKMPTGNGMKVNKGFERPLHIMKFSGKTDEALNMLLERYQSTLSSSDLAVEDIAYTGNIELQA